MKYIKEPEDEKKVAEKKLVEADVEEKGEIKVAGFLNLVADGFHNFTDGLAIGASFAAGDNVGYITTLTILFHEVITYNLVALMKKWTTPNSHLKILPCFLFILYLALMGYLFLLIDTSRNWRLCHFNTIWSFSHESHYASIFNGNRSSGRVRRGISCSR